MYFLDTYAMIEFLRNNKKYVDMINNNQFITSDFQLMELYYSSLRENGHETADKHFEAFSLVKVLIPESTLKNAMKTRLEFQRKKNNLSYVDAIGYQYATDHNMQFLTGDKQFKDIKSKNLVYIH